MIAIKGHLKRGREVIQLLESLGGINKWNHTGGCVNDAYYIDHCNNIYSFGISGYHGDRKIYTLEAFEKEFPFKIGDKVTTTGTSHPKIITGITDTQWGLRYVISEIKFPDSKEMPHISQISLYKEVKEERNITLTFEKAQEWYNKGGELKEIALQAFTEKELNPLPRSWEEFCEKHPIQDHEAFINFTNSGITICKECAGSGLGIWMRKPEKDRCKCVSQKSAEAHLAMMQLEQLRNCWLNGWEPIWDCSEKWCIRLWGNELSVGVATHIARFLTFPTNEMAREFLECFRDLIEKAKDLI